MQYHYVMKNCIVVTGGGTAGHIMPIIALLPELKKHYKEIVYIGSHFGMEKDIIKNYPYVRFCAVDTIKFDRTHLLKNLKIPFVLLKGIKQCKNILKAHNVDCIFSKGGYVSLPCVLASGKIPVIAHESDLSLGLANKIIYHKCKVMCISFTMQKQKRKFVYTGLPIRKLQKSAVGVKLNLQKNKSTLLVIGGSLGATSLNNAVRIVADELCKQVNIIHIVGRGNLDGKTYPKNYNQIEFTDAMGDILPICDCAISRAGATAICELLYFNIPMLLVPLSKKVSRGDQEQNANYYQNRGYANVLLSEHLTPNNLLKSFEKLVRDAESIKAKQQVEKTDATDAVLKQILKYSK